MIQQSACGRRKENEVDRRERRPKEEERERKRERAIKERECDKERGIESREIQVVGRNIESTRIIPDLFQVSAAAAFIGCRE